MTIIRIRETTCAMFGIIPTFHYLSHRDCYTTGKVARAIAFIDGNLSIIWISLVPIGLHKRGDVFTRLSCFGAIGCGGSKGFLGWSLGMGNLLGVLAEPPTEVVGGLVVVEGAAGAITKDLPGRLVSTCDDKTIVVTDIEDVEAGLALALRGVGELEVGG